jgi:hypothetical protein
LLAGIETMLQRQLAYDDLSSSLPVSSSSAGEPKIQNNDVKSKVKI